jgi:photosystem II stability/assembly factor-like uncharacterized protein
VGLLRSADAGASWSRHGGGLPLSDITGLAFAAEGTVFASDFGRGGVYKSADGGVSWSALPPEGLHGERIWALAVGPGSGLDLVAATAASGLRRLESPAAPAAAPASR